ncbi:hypothetical protein I6U33_06445 [Pseudomonas carnis]|uniref:hypothetical protein n=1 Tax=Pseudomonas TaxID=286 RepID=UPI0018E7F169|nr:MULTISPECIES: hypothetical protein [Pseudomonas]MBJ2225656.1 hypothetical protein [Pseudomonas sp. MF7451]MBW9236964.1 hypothetical protein [Pseudomonas carnis]
MKKHWTKLLALAVAACALVGQSVIGYVTENGQLPPWMPEKLGGIASWLSTDLGIPYWSVVLVIVCGGGLGVMFVKYRSSAAHKLNARLASTLATLADSEQRYRSVQVENARLKSSCEDLSRLLEKAQAPAEVEVSAIGFDVMKIMAKYTDAEVRPTLGVFASALGIGNVEAGAAIDDLIEQGFLAKFANVRGVFYRFTPAGRAYYLKHR